MYALALRNIETAIVSDACIVHHRKYRSKFHCIVNQLRRSSKFQAHIYSALEKQCCSCGTKQGKYA